MSSNRYQAGLRADGAMQRPCGLSEGGDYNNKDPVPPRGSPSKGEEQRACARRDAAQQVLAIAPGAAATAALAVLGCQGGSPRYNRQPCCWQWARRSQRPVAESSRQHPASRTSSITRQNPRDRNTADCTATTFARKASIGPSRDLRPHRDHQGALPP